MRFAVLGAGFAGLATTWCLHHYTTGSATVDLFDPRPIGAGVSGLSSGLFHGFGGKRANKAWRVEKCMEMTHTLITEASIGAARPLVLSHGILRPALDEQQITDFKACAENYPEETEWWDQERCEKTIAGLVIPHEGGGLYIPGGLTLNPTAYLEGLWQRCARLGTTLHRTAKISLQNLEKYDGVVVCMGPLSSNFPGLETLPIQLLKGQILELAWPREIPPLPHSLISKKYITMGWDNKTCHVGATFERDFTHPNVEPEKAALAIMPNIVEFFPALKDARICSARAGFRATTPDKLPIVGQLNDRTYFFTGLGSKGLLYHAYVAKRIAISMIKKNSHYLPRDLVFALPTAGEPPLQN